MFNFTIFVILVIFALDVTLSVLNYRNRKAPIPKNVSDIYNQEEYGKWLDYTMEGFRLGIITKVFTTLILLIFLFFNIFNKIASVADQYSHNEILQTLIFLGLYSVISYLLSIGFSVYRTFNIEQRYGFNKTTVKTFILDQLKSIILTALLGGGLMYLILTLYDKLGFKAVFYTWAILMVIILLINVLYTKIFIKIFNKLTPLEDGELKEKATELAKQLGYEIKTISVMDASKRSTRLNAFFSGFGKFKSIVLYDTLIEKCTPDEILSVLAHEIGHSLHKDTLKNFAISTVQIALYMTILGFFLTSETFSTAFGFSGIHLGFSIILFSIILEPISILINIPLSQLSRKAEYKADAVAAKSGYKGAMISALKVLTKENFSNLTPHPLVVKMTYSHPPTSQRIDALEKL
ncbi:MAG: M48 family metallopeptidase [Clostridia bacterium]|nr:M48 family metallopeptidase [Clostridia bacterium]